MPVTIKTLHLTNAFNDQSGGIATFYRALMEAANQQHRPIRLVVPAAEDRVEQVGTFGKIYHVKAPKAPLNDHYRILYPTQFLFPGSRIQEILDAERPDVIEICDKYNLNYLGAVLRIGLIRKLDFRPLVLGLSCERMDDNFSTYLRASRLQRSFCKWYMRWIYFPFFDHHIVVSTHTADELVAASRGHAVQRGVWIRHMGVDVQGFSPARRSQKKMRELRERVQATDNTRLLLYVGRIAPEKNLELLIVMARRLFDLGLDLSETFGGETFPVFAVVAQIELRRLVGAVFVEEESLRQRTEGDEGEIELLHQIRDAGAGPDKLVVDGVGP